MTTNEMLDLFLSIPATKSSGDALEAKLIPGRSGDYIAKGTAGEPIVLIAVALAGEPRPSLRLQNVSADYNVSCKVSDGEKEEYSGKFSSITLLPKHASLTGIFLMVANSFLSLIPENPSPRDVEQAIDSLVDLFGKANNPSRRTVKGLWSELLVILHSGAVRRWAKGWHTSPYETFDFAFGNTRIDVKSTESQDRVHDMSLQQLESQSGASPVFVVSILLKQSAAGRNVLDLTQSVVNELHGDQQLIAKIWNIVFESLGLDATLADDLMFEEAYALSSLKVLDGSLIPRPAITSPLIKSVKFSVDLSQIDAFDSGLTLNQLP